MMVEVLNYTLIRNRIIGNIFFQLYQKSYISDTIEVFNNNQSIFLSDFNQNVYPVASILVEKATFKNNFSLINPTLIVEIISNKISYNQRLKFRGYKSLPSFSEFVLIDERSFYVEVFSKDNSDWFFQDYIGLNETVKLQSLDCEINMSDIYRNVEGLLEPQGKLDLDDR